MKKVSFYTLIFLFAASVFAMTAAKLRLDCSDDKKMQESVIAIIMSLDENTQQQFIAAMATIGVSGMQNPYATKPEGIKEMLNGKTADEIIALARKMAPNLRGNKFIVDAKDMQTFGKSVGEIMLSLEGKKRDDFSEAVAKLMYESQQKKEKPEELLKKLDGKTADEIISLAMGGEVPLSTGVETIKQYQLDEVTKAQAEEILQKKIETKEEPSLQPSLAPNANY